MVIYVKDVSSNVGENALCRKNGQFWHKMRWIWEPTSQFIMKFGLQIDFEVIQKRYAAIFEILIFRDFSGGQSSNFRHFDKIILLNTCTTKPPNLSDIHQKILHEIPPYPLLLTPITCNPPFITFARVFTIHFFKSVHTLCCDHLLPLYTKIRFWWYP